MNSSFQIPSQLFVPIAMVFAAVILAMVAVRLLRAGRYRRYLQDDQAAYRLTLADHQDGNVPQNGPQLSCYNTAVHLPLIVVAPVGRGGQLPHPDLLPSILDRAIPGLRGVLDAHQTATIRWPAQLSTSGFHQRFFKELNLPGEHGKGTMWSASAGCFSTLGHRFSMGLLVRADNPNNLGQFSIDQDSQWLDLFRVHST